MQKIWIYIVRGVSRWGEDSGRFWLVLRGVCTSALRGNLASVDCTFRNYIIVYETLIYIIYIYKLVIINEQKILSPNSLKYLSRKINFCR